jgi:hypothetical protein
VSIWLPNTRIHNKVSIDHMYVRTNGRLIVISIPISLGKQERRLVGSNEVHEHDSIWMEKVGEYIWLLNRIHNRVGIDHMYVVRTNRWLIVISIPISLGKQEQRLVVGSNGVRLHDAI